MGRVKPLTGGVQVIKCCELITVNSSVSVGPDNLSRTL